MKFPTLGETSLFFRHWSLLDPIRAGLFSQSLEPFSLYDMHFLYFKIEEVFIY